MTFRSLLLILLCGLVVSACSKSDTSEPVHVPDVGIDDVGDGEEDVIDEADAEPDAEPEPDVPPGPGAIIVSPDSLTFSDVRLGATAKQVVTIRNVGTGPLTVSELSIAQSTMRTQIEFKRGEDWLDTPVVIEPQTFREIGLVYEPADYVTDRGSLTIHSDDPDQPEIELRIETINAYPDMQAPSSLRFGTVAPGETVTEEVVIYNRGIDPLNITSVTYEGEGEFSLKFPGTQSPPALLQRTHHLVVEVTYAPVDSEPDRGKIFVTSNDPDQETFEIMVLGNGPTPCLSVSGDVEFGEVPVGDQVHEWVTLLNCSGTQSLSITDVEIIDDGAGTFELADTLDLPINLGVRLTSSFRVAARPTTDQDVVGVLKVTSNDPEQNEVELGLRVRGASSN